MRDLHCQGGGGCEGHVRGGIGSAHARGQGWVRVKSARGRKLMETLTWPFAVLCGWPIWILI